MLGGFVSSCGSFLKEGFKTRPIDQPRPVSLVLVDAGSRALNQTLLDEIVDRASPERKHFCGLLHSQPHWRLCLIVRGHAKKLGSAHTRENQSN